MIRYLKYSTCLLLVCSLYTFGRQPTRTIIGIITSYEDGIPLKGITVWVKRSNHYSGSEANGIYYKKISPNDPVLVSVVTDIKHKK